MHIPLDAHKVLQSCDLDEVRERVSSSYCSHSLYLKSSSGRLDTRHHRVSFGDISFNYLTYGADVTVVPGEFERFYMVEIPLAGSACIDYGGKLVNSRDCTGAVVSSTRPVRSEWSADAKRLMVQIDRDVMERFVSTLLGRPLNKPLDFELEIDLSRNIGAGLRSYVEYITQQLDEHNYFDRYILVRKEVIRTLLTMLLNGQVNNYSEEIRAIEAPGAPRHIQRAYEYIMENYGEEIGLEDIVAVAGVSPRALYAGFKRYKGISPMMALKTRRLHAVHEELKNPEPGDSVTRIAFKWGFSHMGNFARDYRILFGEKPSETIHNYQ